jgi:hypothetical protein
MLTGDFDMWEVFLACELANWFNVATVQQILNFLVHKQILDMWVCAWVLVINIVSELVI